jgi:xanthine dehydrogenase molybdopterin-binding subunit B
MGQGLHTKMIQICSHELGVPPEKIVIPSVSAHGVPNAFFTGGSMGTDILILIFNQILHQQTFLNLKLFP